MTNKGILIIADKNQEWILPWWWFNYSKLNTLEVSFVDLGMSKKARSWCKTKGRVLSFQKPPINLSKETVSKDLQQKWELRAKSVWEKRKIWFLKPFALLQTPYDETIYMDLDCEVKTNLKALFSYCEHPSEFSAAYEMDIFQKYYQQEKEILPEEKVINSGLIIYKKTCSFIKLFAEKAQTHHPKFWGDQNLFQRLIFENQIPFNPLPSQYNFLPHPKLDHTNASIVHWGGESGKARIQEQIKAYSNLSFIKWDTF